MASRSITDAAVDGFVTGGGPPPLCVQCDVVDRAAVAAMVADVIKRFSKVYACLSVAVYLGSIAPACCCCCLFRSSVCSTNRLMCW
jgi:hypothetical protein